MTSGPGFNLDEQQTHEKQVFIYRTAYAPVLLSSYESGASSGVMSSSLVQCVNLRRLLLLVRFEVLRNPTFHAQSQSQFMQFYGYDTVYVLSNGKADVPAAV